MPTYQYACPDCGLEFERVQKFTDDPVKKCPKCGKRKVYRVVSKVAVSFKGSGWYITDSKSGAASSNGSSGGAKEQETKTEEKVTEAATESKDATTAETPAKEAAADKKADTKTDKPDKADKKSARKKTD